jgi:hypothetical protein
MPSLFHKFFPTFLIILSLVANLITFIVFSNKIFKKNKIRNKLAFYSRILAVTHSFSCLFYIRHIVSFGYQATTVELGLDIFCKLSVYLISFLTTLTNYIQVITTLDRLIFTFKVNSLNVMRQSFQLSLLFGTFLFSLITSLPKLFINGMKENFSPSNETTNQFAQNSTRLVCMNLASSNINKLVNGWDLVISALIPFFLMLTFTIALIRKLHMTRVKMRNQSITNTMNNSNYLKKADYNFFVVLIIMNLVFLLFNMPIFLFSIFNYIFNFTISDIFAIIQTASTLLFYMNFGSLFWINLILNKLFRKQLLIYISSLKSTLIQLL